MMRVPARLAAFCLLIGPGLFPGLACAAPAQPAGRPAVPLAAHRALYELTLDSARGGRQIAAARGTMGYEVVDVCDGWATRQRLRMTITNSEGQDTDMDSDYATWEAKDGLKFRFHMVQKTDSAVTNQTDGNARLTRTGGTGEAQYRLPKEAKLDLPVGTLFPMMHTAAIINSAREGKKFLALPLFDGTDEDGYEYSSIAIVDWKAPFATDHPILTPLASTRVRVAFFDHVTDGPMPTYEVAMRYWENGVAGAMLMDFGDFVMSGKLKELTPLPRRC
jgi:EipB-like